MRHSGDEVNGVIISNGASTNTIGGTVAGAGNTIAFNILAGVSVVSGTGDSILTNSIYSNGQLGIVLVTPSLPPGPNNLQAAPILTTAVGGGPTSSVQGTLASVPSTSFLIQFFTNVVPDPSGYGQGQTPIGSITVTTDSNGNATFSFTPANSLPANAWVTATATNTSTGDTSRVLQSRLGASGQRSVPDLDLFGRCHCGNCDRPRGARGQPQCPGQCDLRHQQRHGRRRQGLHGGQ